MLEFGKLLKNKQVRGIGVVRADGHAKPTPLIHTPPILEELKLYWHGHVPFGCVPQRDLSTQYSTVGINVAREGNGELKKR